ncbi:MAG: transposase [Candidatus Omnitrophica bacterium]|nr:transposase [Candidatus Omnitrophota bacterium]MDD5430286.1 transposase [Candidatus Omnitrophota bacterium]
MPRNKRLNVIGGVYHVFTRGIERKEIFKDSTDREEFLSRLADTLDKTKSTCYAWALMPNHVHIMLRPGKRTLTDIARRIFTGYAVYFNIRHKRRGYLYQNRYKSILCQEDIYFEELIRYIHLNPLKAKIVSTISQLDKYPWTGHFTIMSSKNCPWQNIDEVLLRFSKKKGKAVAAYRDFIKEGVGKKSMVDFLGGGLIRSAGGWSELAAMRRKKDYWRGDERILGGDSFVNQVLNEYEEKMDQKDKLRRAGWDLTKVIHKVCCELAISEEDIYKKGRNNIYSEAKALICYLANKKLGISGAQIAKRLRISQPAVAKYMIKEIVRERGNKLLS